MLELSSEQHIELLVIVCLGSVRYREKIYQPPYHDAIAGEEFEQAQTCLAQEESIPAQKYRNEQDGGRIF